MNVWRMIEHNRYAVIGILVSLVSAVVFVGCEIKTESLTAPGVEVNETQLEREAVTVEANLAMRQAALNADIEAYNAAAAVARGDLADKAAFRAKVIRTVGAIGMTAAEGTLSPATAAASFIQLLTIGAAGGLLADNRRKDKIIKSSPEPVVEPEPPAAVTT